MLYLPNFTFENEKNPSVVTRLKGTTGKRVILLANLRPQKNHLMLLAVASKLQVSHPDWTFHLVGKDFEDDYALEIKRQIKKLHLENQVFLYGSRTDVGAILQQSTIGVLTSVSEGLPVAVLEYGAHRLPVVVTGVGALPTMIQNGVNGFVVPSQDAEAFGTALTTLIQQDALRDRLAEAFHATINESFAAAAIVDRYLAWLEKG